MQRGLGGEGMSLESSIPELTQRVTACKTVSELNALRQEEPAPDALKECSIKELVALTNAYRRKKKELGIE